MSNNLTTTNLRSNIRRLQLKEDENEHSMHEMHEINYIEFLLCMLGIVSPSSLRTKNKG